MSDPAVKKIVLLSCHEAPKTRSFVEVDCGNGFQVMPSQGLRIVRRFEQPGRRTTAISPSELPSIFGTISSVGGMTPQTLPLPRTTNITQNLSP
jgi:hypothetical protein